MNNQFPQHCVWNDPSFPTHLQCHFSTMLSFLIYVVLITITMYIVLVSVKTDSLMFFFLKNVFAIIGPFTPLHKL